MTDFNPFSASEEAPAYVAEESTETDGGSRKNVVLLGALAAVVLGAGAFFLLGGGDEEVDEFALPSAAPAAAAPAPSASPAAKLPAASNLTLGRNPFRALYVQPAAAPADAPAAAPAPATGGTTTPIIVVGGGPAPAPAQPAPAQPAPAQPAPAPAPEPAQSTLALKSVAAGKDGAHPTATFVYDGKEVSGAPGDVMDGKLLVISIQQDSTGGWFANLQLGDGEPFEVHERQTVVVQ